MKLDDTAITTIRERRAAGEKLASIAFDFDVSESHVGRICKKPIPEPPKVVGPHTITPWIEHCVAFPKRGWTHVRRYRSRAYAEGVAAVFLARWPHLEWCAIGAAVWVRKRRGAT
jgi:hypothetical protein